MKKKDILIKVKELKDLLEFFGSIKTPPFKQEDCPFIGNISNPSQHYYLSEATGGLGCWRWNCPLCGLEEQE